MRKNYLSSDNIVTTPATAPVSALSDVEHVIHNTSIPAFLKQSTISLPELHSLIPNSFS